MSTNIAFGYGDERDWMTSAREVEGLGGENENG